MQNRSIEVIKDGDERGNNMVIKLKFPSGREIFGLATPNTYGGDWDLGPTWNYIVRSDKTYLVDTGRVGMGGKLLELIKHAGIKNTDIDSVIISHGHEDHDGGLFELVRLTGANVIAHQVYDRLSRIYPDMAPVNREKFPASCWNCFMPESFSRTHCLKYHQERNELKIDKIMDSTGSIDENISVYHVPGHSPDSLAVMVGKEVILVGDTILPDITPFPDREDTFRITGEILKPEYNEAQLVYGLRPFIRSLRRLQKLGQQFPGVTVLPGHRLFYNNKWNEMELSARVDELIEHNVQRCSDILQILKKGPKTAEEVAREHFKPSLLKGFGINMGINEILSHCEILNLCGDLLYTNDNRLERTGSSGFESFINSLQ